MSNLYCAPRFRSKELERAMAKIEQSSSSMLWVASSGSSASELNKLKLVGLSLEALEIAARASIDFLSLNSKSILYNNLPDFHIAYIAAKKRAEICGAQIINRFTDSFQWNASDFVRDLKDNRISVASVVPAQLYDIVQEKLEAPAYLQSLLVGGGALSTKIYESARALKWPVLTSYGSTETCAQIASTSPSELESSPMSLKILDHVELRLNSENYLMIKSESLFSHYIFWDSEKLVIQDIEKDPEGFWTSEDKASLEGSYLSILGRGNRFAKVLGENINLHQIENDINLSVNFPCVVLSMPDPRRGEKLVLVIEESNAETFDRVCDFNQKLGGLRKISEVYKMPILRAENHKILYAAMLEKLKLDPEQYFYRTCD